MKTAVTTTGNDLSSPLDGRFGRTRTFVLFDTEDGSWQAHTNEQNYSAAQGAGIQAAQRVIDLGAQAVITGHVGPKAYRILKAAGVRIYLAQDGTVQEALEKMKSGLLTEAQGADVEGHWG
jgi:predicted Fe-Mo cluster-binding NifX family protein